MFAYRSIGSYTILDFAMDDEKVNVEQMQTKVPRFEYMDHFKIFSLLNSRMMKK